LSITRWANEGRAIGRKKLRAELPATSFDSVQLPSKTSSLH
jgi:hypothetical protein